MMRYELATDVCVFDGDDGLYVESSTRGFWLRARGAETLRAIAGGVPVDRVDARVAEQLARADVLAPATEPPARDAGSTAPAAAAPEPGRTHVDADDALATLTALLAQPPAGTGAAPIEHFYVADYRAASAAGEPAADLATAEALHVGLGDGWVMVGPILRSGSEFCRGCLRATAASWQSLPPEAHLSLAALRLASALAQRKLENRSREASPAQHSEATFVSSSDVVDGCYVSLRADCAACGLPGLDSGSVAAIAYEDAMAVSRQQVASPDPTTDDYPALNTWRRDRDRFRPSRPIIRFPGGGTAPGDANLDAAALTWVLERLAGRKHDTDETASPRYWAPAGGNLPSTTLYVFPTGVAGLPDGVYRLSETGLVELPAQLRASYPIVEAPASPSVVVVGIADTKIPAFKYRDFGARLSLLNAGVMRAQLATLVESLTWQHMSSDVWDDARVRRACGLGRDTDTVAFVEYVQAP